MERSLFALSTELPICIPSIVSYQIEKRVQQWLSETLNIEAEYATVHHLVRYRLGAKLKAARPLHAKQNPEALAAFKQTSVTICS